MFDPPMFGGWCLFDQGIIKSKEHTDVFYLPHLLKKRSCVLSQKTFNPLLRTSFSTYFDRDVTRLPPFNKGGKRRVKNLLFEFERPCTGPTERSRSYHRIFFVHPVTLLSTPLSHLRIPISECSPSVLFFLFVFNSTGHLLPLKFENKETKCVRLKKRKKKHEACKNLFESKTASRRGNWVTAQRLRR